MKKAAHVFYTSARAFEISASANPEWRLNPCSFADHERFNDAQVMMFEIRKHDPASRVTTRDALDYLDIMNTAAAENAPDFIDTDAMYEDACASACGF